MFVNWFKSLFKKKKKPITIRPKRGHKLFRFSTTDMSIYLVDDDEYMFEKVRVLKRRKLIAKKNNIYISALNVKNAIKHLKVDYGIDIKFRVW